MPQWLGGNALCNIADRLAALDEDAYYLSRRACLNVWMVLHCYCRLAAKVSRMDGYELCNIK